MISMPMGVIIAGQRHYMNDYPCDWIDALHDLCGQNRFVTQKVVTLIGLTPSEVEKQREAKNGQA